MNAFLTVGLEPSLGFYHQPQRQAPPLALNLMEIFRVPLVDMPRSLRNLTDEHFAGLTLTAQQLFEQTGLLGE